MNGIIRFFIWKEERKYNCCFGVEEILPNSNDSEDLVVIGLVRGTIHVGDKALVKLIKTDGY